MEFNKVNLYRITHIENIPHILQFGITHRDSPNRNPNYKNIGDLSLIETRNKRLAKVDNGEYGVGLNHKLIKLGDFTPFYFGVKMPMLYVAQNGGNFVEKSTAPSDIIYLACNLEKIVNLGIDFFFTDGHATDILSSFYEKSKVNELVSIVDWAAIKADYWGGYENLNIKRKKQAEFLLFGDLSSEYIKGYGCYNELIKDKLSSLGVDRDKIKVIPQAYF